MGTLWNGSTGPAHESGVDARTETAKLVPIIVTPNQVTRRSFLASTHVYAPTHSGTQHRLFTQPYVEIEVGGYGWGATAYGGTGARELDLASRRDAWNLLQIRIDVEVSGGTLPEPSDDTGSVSYTYLVNGTPDGTKQTFTLDPYYLTRATGPVRLGPHFFAAQHSRIAEAFLDNLTASEIFTDTANCQAPNSGTCTTNADCSGGEVCGTDNGTYFGRAAADDVCWLPTCCTSQQPPNSSGTILSQCGTCPSGTCFNGVKEPDESDVDCGGPCAPCGGGVGNLGDSCTDGTFRVGLSCGVDNGWAFGHVGGRYCWSNGCNMGSPQTWCGTLASPCGLCAGQGGATTCEPTCAGKVCGGNSDDGCGGTCVLCGEREGECHKDGECAVGLRCGAGAGPRFGLVGVTNACWRPVCDALNPADVPCGAVSSTCGTCPACQPDCTGKEYGDDGCKGSCGSCLPNEFEGPNFECVGALGVKSIRPAGVDPELYATEAAGTIDGSFAVTHDGQAQYTVPLVLPPGRNGMSPLLSLSYDSAAGNGDLGQGWSLNGLPKITRCPETISHDGHARGLRDADASGVYGSRARCFDLAGLRAAGYEIPSVTRVTSQFGMAGGGYEMQFGYAIPSEFISVVLP
jgi:hypothetical protein